MHGLLNTITYNNQYNGHEETFPIDEFEIHNSFEFQIYSYSCPSCLLLIQHLPICFSF
jgi:hypothetical protein